MKKLLCLIVFLLLLTANVGQAQFNDSEPMFGQQLNLGHWSTDGLVFYWRGIEAGNAVDESFHRNHGTLIGSPTWVGQGLDFDGTTQYITLPATTILTPPYTILVWFQLDSLASVQGDACLVCFSNNSISDFVLLRIGTVDDKIDFSVRQEGGITRVATTTNIVPALTWGMVAAVAHSSSSRYVYYNAAGKGSNADAAAPVGLGTALIGARDLGSIANHLDGQIAQVLFYDRALSISEIQQLYINPDLPMQQEPIWLMYSPAAPPSGIVPIIQAHTRRRRAG